METIAVGILTVLQSSSTRERERMVFGMLSGCLPTCLSVCLYVCMYACVEISFASP
jgi:hypothetical protein